MNWIELKALDTLYHTGTIKLNQTLKSSAEIQFLSNSLNAIEVNFKHIIAREKYRSIYERQYQLRFADYQEFLLRHRLLKPQSQYEEADIRILMEIAALNESGDLAELREQLIAADVSLRNLSLMFFRNEKYLDSKTSLTEALKQLLSVKELSNEKDQQYIIKLECHDTKAIVLCENIDFLKRPVRPRKHGIELWHVGGKNVGKLDYSSTRGLPIYYSCDWDYDGLFVIYPLVKQKIPAIQLLLPNGAPKGIDESQHASQWPADLVIEKIFVEATVLSVVNNLYQQNSWIIEESNDLIEMFRRFAVVKGEK